MRLFGVLTMAIVLSPSMALAQHRPRPADDAGPSESPQEIIRQIEQMRAEAAQSSAAIRSKANSFNSQADQLTASRTPLGAQIDLMNNVVSYRKKSDFDAKIDEMRRKYNAEYGDKIRIVNPYDNSEYTRYYDDKGYLVVSKVKNSYELLQQQREDWQKARQKAVQTKDEIDRDYAKLEQQVGSIAARQSDLAVAQEEAQRRYDQFGSTINSVPRRPVAEIESPGPVQPPPPGSTLTRAQVVGTWMGVSVQGGSQLRVTNVFQDNGQVTNSAENGMTGRGTWELNGDFVQVTWSNGARVAWQLRGNQLTGSGTTSRGQPWSLSLQKQ